MTKETDLQIYSLEESILTQRIELKKDTKVSYVKKYNDELQSLIQRRKELRKRMRALRRETREIIKHFNSIGVGDVN